VRAALFPRDCQPTPKPPCQLQRPLPTLCHLKFGLFYFFTGWAVIIALILPETKNVPIEEMVLVWKSHWFWPDQAYSSLRDLAILGCPSLEVLPPCLKQRLNDIKDKDLDARYTGNELMFLRVLCFLAKM
jgi:hypothetical protein